jgi:Holliday junction resolvase
MFTYKKGARAEHELIDYFDSHGFSVIRAAGSGVSSLSPDILVFKRGLQYAFEAKAHETENLSLDKEQVIGLRKWEENTGITAYVGWRRNREPWYFIPLSVLKENDKTFSMNWKQAQLIGRKIEELVEEGIKT